MLTFGLPAVYHPLMARESTNPREAPVSFRPGRLRGVIGQRAVRNLTEGQIAKRDLGRYYLLLNSVPLGDRLTKREASWLAEADFRWDVDNYLNPFASEHEDPSEQLVREVQHYQKAFSLDSRHEEVGEAVLAKVAAMSSLERAALMDAVDRLPAQQEEEIGNPDDWSLIGVRLIAEPADTPDKTGDAPRQVLEAKTVAEIDAPWRGEEIREGGAATEAAQRAGRPTSSHRARRGAATPQTHGGHA